MDGHCAFAGPAPKRSERPTDEAPREELPYASDVKRDTGANWKPMRSTIAPGNVWSNGHFMAAVSENMCVCVRVCLCLCLCLCL
jgi:hypothetical protein